MRFNRRSCVICARKRRKCFKSSSAAGLHCFSGISEIFSSPGNGREWCEKTFPRTLLSRFYWRLFRDRKSTRLNSSHLGISYAVFCLKKKKKKTYITKDVATIGIQLKSSDHWI